NVRSLRSVPHWIDRPSGCAAAARLGPAPAPRRPGRRTSPAPRPSGPPRTDRTGTPAHPTSTHAARPVTVGDHLPVTRQYAQIEADLYSYLPHATPGVAEAQALALISGRIVPRPGVVAGNAGFPAAAGLRASRRRAAAREC